MGTPDSPDTLDLTLTEVVPVVVDPIGLLLPNGDALVKGTLRCSHPMEGTLDIFGVQGSDESQIFGSAFEDKPCRGGVERWAVVVSPEPDRFHRGRLSLDLSWDFFEDPDFGVRANQPGEGDLPSAIPAALTAAELDSRWDIALPRRPARSGSDLAVIEWALRDSNPRPSPCKGETNRAGHGLEQGKRLSCVCVHLPRRSSGLLLKVLRRTGGGARMCRPRRPTRTSPRRVSDASVRSERGQAAALRVGGVACGGTGSLCKCHAEIRKLAETERFKIGGSAARSRSHSGPR